MARLNRGVARAAVAGLAAGLLGLAGLALWGNISAARTASSVRAIDKVSDEWGQVFLHVSTEYETLNDFLRAQSTIGREPLVSSIGSAVVDLQWLRQQGGEDTPQAVAMLDTYDAYTQTLRELVAAAAQNNQTQVMLDAEQAGLSASTLRKQTVANTIRKRLELAVFLDEAQVRNQQLRLAAAIITAIDVLFLVLCSFALLRYQVNIERLATASRHEAMHDVLTGVPNRLLLADRMAQALRAARRDGGTVALLLLDLDRFKEVNDTLGHHFGDLLLQQVATRLAGVVRDHDTIARLGGDEFAVLLPDAGTEGDMLGVAQRILDALQQVANLEGTSVDVRASIGAAIHPVHSANAAELLQHADIAMYAAKRGHLGVALYNPAGEDRSSDQLTMLGELQKAMDDGELVLHFQPKVNGVTLQVTGVEALARWQHPRRGLLGPGEFIPLAEQSGIIHPLTEHLLVQALRQQRRWTDGGRLLPVAVNLAPQCLLHPDFVARVSALLDEYATPHGQLTLEITEGAVIGEPDRAALVLGQLRELGVRTSIDDFGTGYSSMAYLQRLPLDELKIDRCFALDMRTSEGSVAIVIAIVGLAHALGLEVVAEGVEDEITLRSLVEAGADSAQGFFLCRPLPAADLEIWLAAQPIQVIAPAL